MGRRRQIDTIRISMAKGPRGPRMGCTAYGVASLFGMICLAIMGILLFKARGSASSEKAASQQQKVTSSSGRPAMSAAVMRRLATALDGEIMQNVPASSDQYIKDLKNPCWEHDGAMRCLPYFVSAMRHWWHGRMGAISVMRCTL